MTYVIVVWRIHIWRGLVLQVFLFKIIFLLKVYWSSPHLIDSISPNTTVKAALHLVDVPWSLCVKTTDSSAYILVGIESSLAWIGIVVGSIYKCAELQLVCHCAHLVHAVLRGILLLYFLALKLVLLDVWEVNVYWLLAKFYYRSPIFENVFKN